MSELSIEINQANKNFYLDFIPENPYVRLVDVIKLGANDVLGDEVLSRIKFQIHDNGVVVRSIPLKRELLPYDVPGLMGRSKVSVRFVWEEEQVPSGFKLVLIYCNSNVVGLSAPSLEFLKEFEYEANRRIFLSGKFGSGKSTFLKYFFDKEVDKYNVFTVSPVHYSIASNEDVFKYIKADILYQLLPILSPNILIEEKSSFITKVGWLIYSGNWKKSFSSFVDTLSKLGKSIPNIKAKLVFSSLEALNKIFNELEKDWESFEPDGKEIIGFLESLESEEGGLFEYDKVSRLIEAFLELLEKRTEKKNILLIDDLDRIDPEHVFRVLNVISAHFDPALNHELEKGKFGFDKIIVVSDLANIEGVFRHRYGKNVDFDGYIQKFSSLYPFIFNNNDAMTLVSLDLLKSYEDNPRVKFLGRDFEAIFTLLRINNQISLRDLVRLTHIDLDGYVDSSYNYGNYEGYSKSYILISVLSRIWTLDGLERRLVECEGKKQPQGYAVRGMFRDYLPGLGYSSDSTEEGYYTLYLKNNKALRFRCFQSDDYGVSSSKLVIVKKITLDLDDHFLKEDDVSWDLLIDILLRQIERFKKE